MGDIIDIKIQIESIVETHCCHAGSMAPDDPGGYLQYELQENWMRWTEARTRHLLSMMMMVACMLHVAPLMARA
ncbi:hypothetical protein GN958_ATG03986 [Phytophthora infestans]|uniref:Uncharacterized protein n=1 Tax=Phytophthora infestans TaxID=4787 RepID=A0A8S9V6M3_PHYIN|nr:hypothetical protein GN958_ATG03986 [Phytophthora infestans]